MRHLYKTVLMILIPGNMLFAKAEPSLLYMGGGIFNVLQRQKTFSMQLEYRSSTFWYQRGCLFIRPLVALMGTDKGETYACGGVAFDCIVSKHFAVTPSFAPGVYFKGSGKDLGFPLEFRSSFELSYRQNNGSRFGAMFYHISNASIGKKNPGVEALVFFYGIAL